MAKLRCLEADVPDGEVQASAGGKMISESDEDRILMYMYHEALVV